MKGGDAGERERPVSNAGARLTKTRSLFINEKIINGEDV